jgi:hypothetical protein
MTFSRVKALGWATNEKLTSAQMNALDEDHADAIDGVGGGTYTINAPLEINGDDVTLGDFSGGRLISAGDALVNGSLDVAGATTLASVDVTGTTSLTGALTANGNTTIGNASGDAHSITGTTTVNGPVVFAAPGRPRYTTATLTDANTNITPVTANIYYMPSGVMSTGRTLTVDDTNCGNGDWIWIWTDETTNGLTVNGPGGTPTYVTLLQAAADQPAVQLCRIGGTWRMIGRYQLP